MIGVNMRKLRKDIYEDAVMKVQRDLFDMQISQRCAAGHIGIAHSTFNAFLNQEYMRPNPKTLAQILATPVWTEATITALVALRDYETRLFSYPTLNRDRSIDPGVECV